MQDNNTGWICPKCGSCYAPRVDKCTSCSNEWTIQYAPQCTCGQLTIGACPVHYYPYYGSTVGFYGTTPTSVHPDDVDKPVTSGTITIPANKIPWYFDFLEGVDHRTGCFEGEFGDIAMCSGCGGKCAGCAKRMEEAADRAVTLGKPILLEERLDVTARGVRVVEEVWKCNCRGLGPCPAKECEYRG